MRTATLTLSVAVAISLTLAPVSSAAGERVPGEQWLRFAEPREAGFDPARLEAARATWEELPSAAFMVVADGAVVAAWGDVDRRFMCHSVRKSFLSALYGVYWDRGEIDLNKTLFDLGVDDTPDPLLDVERHARILDLLKARSGIFHPAAYAGRTDSAERGSKGAGRYFAYNNWDFNTLATILIEETGDDVFEAFDEYFGRPLGMEDWRVADGYYHYERDKSRYPAYPFRLSARDAARFGLLFAREGQWGDQRVLSRHWVRRSSALYSIDDEIRGYGFMWWIYREPRFEKYGMYSALGVGNQMIAVVPEIDMVIVNRANTYEGQGTPDGPLRDLIEQVLEARVGAPAANARLEPLRVEPESYVTEVPVETLQEFAGRWASPPASFGLPASGHTRVTVGPGHLIGDTANSGTFKLYVQPDGSLMQEDSQRRFVIARDGDGRFDGIADVRTVVSAALAAAADGRKGDAERLLGLVKDEAGPDVEFARAMLPFLEGGNERSIRALIERDGGRPVEQRVNRLGYFFLGAERAAKARDVLALNTRLFPESSNVWDSLGEACMTLGEHEAAIGHYRKSLELNEDNGNARTMIARMEGASGA